MEDMEQRMELMQEQINTLGDCVKAQIGTINTLLGIVQDYQKRFTGVYNEFEELWNEVDPEHYANEFYKNCIAKDIKIPDNIVYFNPTKK